MSSAAAIAPMERGNPVHDLVALLKGAVLAVLDFAPPPFGVEQEPVSSALTTVRSESTAVAIAHHHHHHHHHHVHHHHHHLHMHEEGDPNRSCVDILRRLLGAGGATELRISALPARVLKVENGVVEDPLEFEQTMCSICLDDYECNNRVRVLKCGHAYHTSCIDVWLRKRATCPMCQLVVC